MSSLDVCWVPREANRMLDITKGSWWVHEDWPKSEGERIFSFLKRDRHTEEENRTEKLSQQTKLLDCITTESTVQGAIHRCKTDFKNYENYLEKDIYRQNTEENLQWPLLQTKLQCCDSTHMESFLTSCPFWRTAFSLIERSLFSLPTARIC